MDHVVRFFLSTAGAIVWLLAAAAWVVLRPRSAAARRALFVIAIVYALASIYAVPALVGRVLSAGYHPFTAADAPQGRTAVVVLGAEALRIQGWDENLSLSLMTNVQAARVLEAWRVFRLIAPAIVVTSGGLPHGDEASTPSGENMHDELVRLGVPDSRIMVETASHDTHDEAVIVAPMLRAQGIEHVVLVTSETHMRRSIAVFRAQGWNAVPAIAPDPARDSAWSAWLVPSSKGLDLSHQVMHELIGVPYYWVRGWEQW
ncbi:MAG TPA: YdcF family protein [Vicinamibacterales bacterium]|jgi:uncharacterized SAM-binding protein YcdF (DUF218 family)|nr:YdcF family protein [Vicinamibacterales bacterium]